MTTTLASNFLERAALLTERNIPIVPVNAGEKRCQLPGWPQQATTVPSMIASWAELNADFNTAAVASFNGVIILDCDVPGIPMDLAKAGIDTKTFTVLSGGKRTPHIYYRQTDYSRAKIKQNICKSGAWDVKAN